MPQWLDYITRYWPVQAVHLCKEAIRLFILLIRRFLGSYSGVFNMACDGYCVHLGCIWIFLGALSAVL